VPRTTARPPVVRAILALAAAAVGLCALIYLVAVRTTDGQRLDDAARGSLSPETSPRAYDATGDLLDTISVSSLALLGAGVVAIALLRGRVRLAVGAAALVLGANVTSQALKDALPRPELAGNALEPDFGSFPSGHVTVAMSLALALMLVVPPALRWASTVVGAAYAAGVGVAVIALDWHRPSDVLGAYLVCVTWAAAVAAVLVTTGGRREMSGAAPPSPRSARLAGGAAAALGLGFAAVVAVTAARRLDLLRVVDDRTAFAAASLVCAAACLALTALVAATLQRAAGRPPRPRRRAVH
jgi:membrane-associated phospholipid phosphatase